MLLLIDNYDSFTFNLAQYLGELGAEVVVRRNDEVAVDDIAAMGPDRLVLSPGPGRPEGAGVTIESILAFGLRMPVLGVCLGHQAIGQAFGGAVVRAPVLMHGKTSTVEHDAKGLFRGLTAPFEAARYHSLVIEPTRVPDVLEVSARTVDDGTIMGVRHRQWPVHGVQFHPESVLTTVGKHLLRNFLEM
jgi:anthranilate synthase/aminodeoxychorismate synthase-like glutamine amidotransferase